MLFAIRFSVCSDLLLRRCKKDKNNYRSTTICIYFYFLKLLRIFSSCSSFLASSKYLAWLCNQANIQELTISRLSVCIPDICIADIPTCASEKAAGNECRLLNFTSFLFFFLSQQNRLAVSACLVNIQFSSRCCVAVENCGS